MKNLLKNYTNHQIAELANSLGYPGSIKHSKVGYLAGQHFGLRGHWKSILYQCFARNLKVEGVKRFCPKYLSKKPYHHRSYLTVDNNEFLNSYEWRKVRLIVLKRDGSKCACCGATPATGAVMNVDHIKPRKTHPELALDTNNLQVLCHECNHGKGNWDDTDFR